MAVRLVREGSVVSSVAHHRHAAPVLRTCALVNNMPDGAFDATERQFLGLLDAGSGAEPIGVRRYALPGVPRGVRTAARIEDEYGPLEEVWAEPPDLLIVTGSEPLAPLIEDEPYWADLVGLLCWAREHVPSMLLSCLSAHAALAVFDGLSRTPLAAKCTGVFPQDADRTHPLTDGLDTDGLDTPLVLPHSRLNAVPTEAVTTAGYRPVLQSQLTGWSVITKVTGHCEVVLVQGHPEYESSSLLREYHRDVRRYLHQEREQLPCLPWHCLKGEDWEQLQLLHQRMVDGERDPGLMDSFPFDEAGARAGWPWRQTAVRLYANWLAAILKRSD